MGGHGDRATGSKPAVRAPNRRPVGGGAVYKESVHFRRGHGDRDTGAKPVVRLPNLRPLGGGAV